MRPNNSDPRRKRRKRSGPELNDHFEAPNIHTQRLTLKPRIGPGLFNKGRASAQVDRRGLPDLTFSEMKFLSKKSDFVHANNTYPNRQRPSEYLSNATDEGSNPFSSRLVDVASRVGTATAYTLDNPISGAVTNSRDILMNELSPVHSILQKSHQRTSNTEGPMHPVPWSFSPVRPMSHARSIRKRPDMLDGNASRLWTSSVADRSGTIHPMSSASNQMVKDQVDKMLFGDIRSNVLPVKRYISLEDLILLASKQAEERQMLVPALGSPDYPPRSNRPNPLTSDSRKDCGPYSSGVLYNTGSDRQTAREHQHGAQEIKRTSDLVSYRPPGTSDKTQSHHKPPCMDQIYLPSGHARALGAADTHEQSSDVASLQLPSRAASCDERSPLRVPRMFTDEYQGLSTEQTAERYRFYHAEHAPGYDVIPQPQHHNSSDRLDLFDKQLLDTESGDHLKVHVSPHFHTRPPDEESQEQWSSTPRTIQIEVGVGRNSDGRYGHDEAQLAGQNDRRIYSRLENKWAPETGVFRNSFSTPFRGFDRPHILY